MSRVSNPVMEEIGKRIAQQRESQGISQIELGIRADIHYTTISEIESGKRKVRLDTLLKIAAALEVPLSVLQPEELDTYTEIPAGMIGICKKLKTLSVEKQHTLMALFDAMIDRMGHD